MRAPSSSLGITVKVIRLQKSHLERLKFFSRFLNTLTAEDKYSLISKDNWMQRIQMHLSQKQKIFSEFLSYFFRISIKFRTFSKKDDPHSLCISEITHHEGRA